MDAAKDQNPPRSSAAPSRQSQPSVYHSETAPSARSASSTRRASSKPLPSHVSRKTKHSSGLTPDIFGADQTDRPQHPSLTRVKGRINMNTPPQMSPERSWLKDQSPVRPGTGTPPRSTSKYWFYPMLSMILSGVVGRAELTFELPIETPESGTPTLVNPASSLLQDLLKEQRAHRTSRGPASENWDGSRPRTPENRRVQEDTASEKSQKPKDVLGTTSREQPKEMGVREMDQYVSKITKLNFDLKLEIFHRTQQMGTMEKKLARMQEMEEELQQMQKLEEEVVELRAVNKHNRSLQELNDQLREELQKRDQAVTEAVQLICQLEAKVDALEMGRPISQISLSRLVLDGPNTTSPKSKAALEIPERTSSRRASLKSPDSRTLNKAPSFLRADNKSTATLRSLYAPEVNESHSALSELTTSESYHTMNEILDSESPRLSVLSECSELQPYDTPIKWGQFDQLDLPVRKAPPSTSTFDSYIPPAEKEKQNNGESIDPWTESGPDMSQTIIRRRMDRPSSDASKLPPAPFNLYSAKPAGRSRLDESVFGGARLPPTPDTMSTAHVAGRNGSNGSMAASARRSPKAQQDQWAVGRPLERHRSADELSTRTRRSFNGSDVTGSMQTNCSDTPRLGVLSHDESPTIYPFNTVASKASELLGPGSPNNPAMETSGGHFRRNSRDSKEAAAAAAAAPSVPPYQTPTKTVRQAKSMESESSPPLTPQEWIAAAKQGPRSRKERAHGLHIDQDEREDELPHNVISQAAFHDDGSVDSYPMETDAPGIPTLDMATLNILEQPIAEAPEVPGPVPKPEAEQRRRFSFRPAFLNPAHTPRRLQHPSTAPDLTDEEDEGAPSPIIPKTRNMGGAARRPMSQIITNSAELYSNVPAPIAPSAGFVNENHVHKSFHQSLMETREGHAALPNASATIAGRPTTSHSADHKRRSSLGILGWMKGMGGKRLEHGPSDVVDKFPEFVKDTRPISRLTHESSRFTLGRPGTPESMDAPVVRPRSELTSHSDDQSRRPRYMGRRARRA
ncbi:hypothetical protein N7532_008111 [Penicillium argentinense]|uniref:Centrosomin N-terminal motif 1 domain-containing protein n=1 Tax=Penicillium argentinense TaxID=1131581 RepID=A0A9W9EWS8_9EURO|nr:uncharacterized protein N7532_008111 [Penicillium argentinense]KAJ5089427.1 hypothetical protein N7532_008111 [Penicillium argentinense]